MTWKTRLWYTLPGGFFVIVDRIFKHVALTHPTSVFVWKNVIGWEYFANTGIAFSIPLPLVIVVPLSLVLIGLLVYHHKDRHHDTRVWVAVTLIIFGALSNVLDRAVWGFTIDYLRVINGVGNVADGMIGVGALLLFFNSNKEGYVRLDSHGSDTRH